VLQLLLPHRVKDRSMNPDSTEEIDPLASSIVDPPRVIAESAGTRPAAMGARSWSWRPILEIVAPVVAAGTALAIHWLLPVQQSLADGEELPKTWMDTLPPAQRPYPLLLAALLAVSLLAVVVQWAWRPLRPWSRHYGPLAAGGLFLLGFWELVTAKLGWMLWPYFPGPDRVLGGLVADRSMLLQSTLHSLRLLACGYLAGVTAGLVTGVLIGWFVRVRYWGMPILKLLGPLPATALVPLVMILPVRDYLFLSGAALIAFAVWFPVTMLTSSGIANVRLSYLDVARTLGAGRLYLIFRVAVPSALPNVFVGLFMGLGASFLTLIPAETLGVEAGLGWYIGMQRGYADYAKVYGSLLIMVLFFSTLMTLLFKLRDHVLKWQKGVIKW
jgi:NitT/TauT family transport system permease protein